MPTPAYLAVWMDKRKYRVKRREKGICVDCSNPVVPGYVRCARCLQAAAKANRKYRETNREAERIKEKRRRERRADEGRCIRCSAPLREDEGRYCVYCMIQRGIPKAIPVKRGVFCEVNNHKAA